MTSDVTAQTDGGFHDRAATTEKAWLACPLWWWR